MKIVVFGPEKRVGVWADDLIVDLALAGAKYKLPPDLAGLIAGGDAALVNAAAAVKAALALPPGERKANGVYESASVKLHAPLVPGARIACAGGNFADHTAAMLIRHKHMPQFESPDLDKITAEMRSRGIWGFWKVGHAPTPPGGNLAYPARTKRLDYEGEPAIVLKKPAKNAKAADLMDYVWGISLFGDWSIRDLNEGGALLKFAMQKNFDGSFSVGPCILVGEDLRPADMAITTTVSGEERQNFNSSGMAFSFGEYLEYLSTDLTLQPGDVISGGTAAGTAADSSDLTDGIFAPERFLKVGDTVEIRSERIGTLSIKVAPTS